VPAVSQAPNEPGANNKEPREPAMSQKVSKVTGSQQFRVPAVSQALNEPGANNKGAREPVSPESQQ